MARLKIKNIFLVFSFAFLLTTIFNTTKVEAAVFTYNHAYTQNTGDYYNGVGYMIYGGDSMGWFVKDRRVGMGRYFDKNQINSMTLSAAPGGGCDTCERPIEFWISSDDVNWYYVGVANGVWSKYSATLTLTGASLPITNIRYIKFTSPVAVDFASVSIDYNDNTPPSMSIVNTDVTINGSQNASLSGRVYDAQNNNVTISATIAGVTKSATITGTSTSQAWNLTWSGAELPQGVYTNIPVSANDGAGGTASATYTGRLIVDKTNPIIGSIDGTTRQGNVPSFRVHAYNVSDSGGSGLSRVEYWTSLNGTAWVSHGAGFTWGGSGENNYIDIPNRGQGTYTIHVRAYDNAGNVVGPLETYAVLDWTAPSDPGTRIVGVTQTSVEVNWNTFNDAHPSSGQSYNTLHAQKWNPSTGAWENTVDIDGNGSVEYGLAIPIGWNGYTVSTLQPGNRYRFTMQHADNSGNWSPYTWREVWTLPQAPTQITGYYGMNAWSNTRGTGHVTLNWNATPGATGYKVWIFNGNAYEVLDVGNVTTWTTKGKKIFPNPSLVNSWADDSIANNVFDFSGTSPNHGELWDNPNGLYQKTLSETYDNDTNYWFRVSAYNSSGETGADFNYGYFPKLQSRTDSIAPNGAVTQSTNDLAESVTLTATGSETDENRTIYLRGTGYENDNTRALKVGKSTIYTSIGRGLRYVALDRNTLNVVWDQIYDVYGSEAEQNRLATDLNNAGNNVLVTLTSYDAVHMNTALVEAIKRVGGSGTLVSYRQPYALIGVPGSGLNAGVESITAVGAHHAEIQVKIVNGNIVKSDVSGFQKIKKPDGSFVNASSTTYRVNQNGTYTFEFHDNAGNITTRTVTISNVNQKPVLGNSITVDKSIVKKGETLNISGTINDADSNSVTISGTLGGVTKSTTVSDGNGNWTLSFTGEELGDSQHNSIRIYANDSYWNLYRDYVFDNVMVDITDPFFWSATQNPKGPTNGDVEIQINVADAYSGIKQIKLPNNTYLTGGKTNAVYSVSQNGRYVFEVEDKTGNMVSYAVEITNIDRDEPVITGLHLMENINGTFDVYVQVEDGEEVESATLNTGETLSFDKAINRFFIKNLTTKPSSISIVDKAGNQLQNQVFAASPSVTYPPNYSSNGTMREDVVLIFDGTNELSYKLGVKSYNCSTKPCDVTVTKNQIINLINTDDTKSYTKIINIQNIDKTIQNVILNGSRDETNPNIVTLNWNRLLSSPTVTCSNNGADNVVYPATGQTHTFTGENKNYECYVEGVMDGQTIKSNTVSIYVDYKYPVVNTDPSNGFPNIDTGKNVYEEKTIMGSTYYINLNRDNTQGKTIVPNVLAR